ncbi:MAG: hypothetical protein GF317_13655 [Candidatus Lokiarchaeota archaeon]|nr:hypothetical protein [Candidatus Lokiarchaeota archaeon]
MKKKFECIKCGKGKVPGWINSPCPLCGYRGHHPPKTSYTLEGGLPKEEQVKLIEQIITETDKNAYIDDDEDDKFIIFSKDYKKAEKLSGDKRLLAFGDMFGGVYYIIKQLDHETSLCYHIQSAMIWIMGPDCVPQYPNQYYQDKYNIEEDKIWVQIETLQKS